MLESRPASNASVFIPIFVRSIYDTEDHEFDNECDSLKTSCPDAIIVTNLQENDTPLVAEIFEKIMLKCANQLLDENHNKKDSKGSAKIET